MTKKEIKKKFAPRRCENQAEFEQMMNEINHAQIDALEPYREQEQKLLQKSCELEVQKTKLNQQLIELKISRLAIESSMKEIHCFFHELKHDLVILNPRESFIKQEEV